MIRSLFHDIKNPLAVTLGSLQVAKMVARKELSPKALRLLDSAEEGGMLQLAMIHNLSEQIKIETGEQTLFHDMFDPGVIVKSRLDKLMHLDLQREFSFEDRASGIHAVGDYAAFERAIINLFENCLKHTRKGGRIISVANKASRSNVWKLTVTDDGELLHPEQFDSIFDRHKITVTKNLGARRDIGMGLSYARIAIRSMGGDLIAVENGEVGAKFVLSLKCRL